MTTAPTAATSSRNDAASNGSRKRFSSSSPIWPGEPKPAPTLAPVLSRPDSDEPSTAIDSSRNSTSANTGPSTRSSPLSGRSGSSAPPM